MTEWAKCPICGILYDPWLNRQERGVIVSRSGEQIEAKMIVETCGMGFGFFAGHEVHVWLEFPDGHTETLYDYRKPSGEPL